MSAATRSGCATPLAASTPVRSAPARTRSASRQPSARTRPGAPGSTPGRPPPHSGKSPPSGWSAIHERSRPLVRDRTTLFTHILPTFGAVPISQISPVQVQRLVTRWSQSLGPRTVVRQYAVLRAIFTYALDTDRIGRSPCRRINLPEPRPTLHLLAAPEQLHELAEQIDERSRPMVYLGAVLGLRWGEAAGLRVGDIDFEARTITVATQRTRGPGGRMITGDPKWNSQRTLAAPEALLELLARHLETRGLSEADADTPICAGDDGAPLDYNNWRQRQWVPATKAAGLSGLRFQSLRTANTTAMAALAVDVKTAQTRAGHKERPDDPQYLRPADGRRRPGRRPTARRVLPRRGRSDGGPSHRDVR